MVVKSTSKSKSASIVSVTLPANTLSDVVNTHRYTATNENDRETLAYASFDALYRDAITSFETGKSSDCNILEMTELFKGCDADIRFTASVRLSARCTLKNDIKLVGSESLSGRVSVKMTMASKKALYQEITGFKYDADDKAHFDAFVRRYIEKPEFMYEKLFLLCLYAYGVASDVGTVARLLSTDSEINVYQPLVKNKLKAKRELGLFSRDGEFDDGVIDSAVAVVYDDVLFKATRSETVNAFYNAIKTPIAESVETLGLGKAEPIAIESAEEQVDKVVHAVLLYSELAEDIFNTCEDSYQSI